MSAIEELVTELSRLPTIGRKSAWRLTYHLLKQPSEQSKRLARALETLAERVRRCEQCHNLTEAPLCNICADPRRDAGLLCVVEEPQDIGAIERSGEFRGMYHVLGGRLSPLDGIGPDDLTVESLIGRVRVGTVREVIVATNPKLEGEATALYVHEQLLLVGALHRPGEAGTADVVVTRLARGLPVGGDLEYADGVTIAQAFSARRGMS